TANEASSSSGPRNPAARTASLVQIGRGRTCGSHSQAWSEGNRKISANGLVATTRRATTARASSAPVVPASSSVAETGPRGASRARPTSQPTVERNTNASTPITGQLVAGPASGGSATAGADGQIPISANSSNRIATQSQNPTRGRHAAQRRARRA